ncbi:MAG: hypothetical protein IJ730_08015, partial [Alphaproteobacteria bacterium]|nr:hypothetical protein [Alphaproteobacteria bacterium]
MNRIIKQKSENTLRSVIRNIYLFMHKIFSLIMIILTVGCSNIYYNENAFTELCRTEDNIFKIYENKNSKIFIQYKNNIINLNESCCRSSAKIYKLKNGDALLSILQSVGTGVYINKLLLLHVEKGKLYPQKFSIEELFSKAREQIKLVVDNSAKLVKLINKNYEISFPVEEQYLDITSLKAVFSPNQINYDLGDSPKVSFVISLIKKEN